MFKELIWVVFVNVSQYKFEDLWNIAVAPFAGAWIEIINNLVDVCIASVAPFAGAWIEIVKIAWHMADSVSLPSRERGLK